LSQGVVFQVGPECFVGRDRLTRFQALKQELFQAFLGVALLVVANQVANEFAWRAVDALGLPLDVLL
jgi:hypothetical protein